jgi:hypothetical protein
LVCMTLWWQPELGRQSVAWLRRWHRDPPQ